jgi:hypothetical protein
LDPVASISLAYCWVSSTPSVSAVDRDRRPFGLPRLCSHSGCIGSGSMSWPFVRLGPHKITTIIFSIRSRSGGPQYSNHSMHSHSGGPLGTHSYRSLLGFACSHTSPASSPGPCCLLVVILSRGLGIFSRGLVLSALDSHGLSSLDSRGPLSILIGLHGLLLSRVASRALFVQFIRFILVLSGNNRTPTT